MASEDGLQKLCIEEISDHLDKSEYTGISVVDDVNDDDREVQILTDLTFVPEDDEITVYIGSHKADVILYKTAYDFSELIEANTHFTTSHGLSTDEIKLPLVALELKRGSGDSDSPSTDEIRARSKATQEAKNVFPFLGYFLVVDNSMVGEQKLYRAGTAFDAAFTPDGGNEADTEWVREQLVKGGIEPHLQRLDRLGVLGE